MPACRVRVQFHGAAYGAAFGLHAAGFRNARSPGRVLDFREEQHSDYFQIPATRIEMIPGGFGSSRPVASSLSDPSAQSGKCGAEPLDAICAVGSQGRDYGTLLEAMRQLPHIRLILVAGAENLRGLDPPPNVEVLQDIPLADAEAVIHRSRFLVVPLWDSQTACGHVTIIYSMFSNT